MHVFVISGPFLPEHNAPWQSGQSRGFGASNKFFSHTFLTHHVIISALYVRSVFLVDTMLVLLCAATNATDTFFFFPSFPPVVYFFVTLLTELSAQFTDDPTLAICNDSGGSVFELSFK